LQRVVSLNIVTSLNTTRLGGLTEVFNACDLDKNGTLSPSELEMALRAAGVNEVALSQMAEALQGHCRYMEFSTFLSGTLLACEGLLDDLLWKEFIKIDRDRSGFLSKNELALLLKDIGCTNMIFSQLDSTHDGRISFDEFKTHFRQKGSNGLYPSPVALAGGCGAAEPVRVAPQLPESNPAADVDALLLELENAKCGETRGAVTSKGGRDVPQEVAEALFDQANLDRDGVMSSAEFGTWVANVAHSTRLCSKLIDSKVLLDFTVADTNGDSVVDRNEWADVLNAVAEIVGQPALRKLAEDWSSPTAPTTAETSPGTFARPNPSQEWDVDGLIDELGL